MIKVTTGDTQPLLTLTLYTDEAKTTLLDLTTATQVVWHFTSPAGDVTKTATIAADPTTGVTTWQWDGDPLIPPGGWNVKAVITWNDSTVETSVTSVAVRVLDAA